MASSQIAAAAEPKTLSTKQGLNKQLAILFAGENSVFAGCYCCGLPKQPVLRCSLRGEGGKGGEEVLHNLRLVPEVNTDV